MTNKQINPRLIELAKRTHNPELVEKIRIEEEKKDGEKKEGLRKQEKLEKHLRNLRSLESDKLDTAIYAFVNHPDFPIIYNQANTIENVADKTAYILRKAYEISEGTDISIGGIFQSNDLEFKERLEEYGLYLLCPYFKSDDKALTKELCLIDREPILSSCKGQHQFRKALCKVFEDRSIKAASGMINLPKIEKPPLKKQTPKIKVEPVDIDDLYDWWQREAVYN